MDKAEIALQALRECDSLKQQHPRCPALNYVAVQMRYLLELLNGEPSDKSRLKDVNVGLIALREFDTRFPEFADQLMTVAKIVDDLRYAR